MNATIAAPRRADGKAHERRSEPSLAERIEGVEYEALLRLRDFACTFCNQVGEPHCLRDRLQEFRLEQAGHHTIAQAVQWKHPGELTALREIRDLADAFEEHAVDAETVMRRWRQLLEDFWFYLRQELSFAA